MSEDKTDDTGVISLQEHKDRKVAEQQQNVAITLHDTVTVQVVFPSDDYNKLKDLAVKDGSGDVFQALRNAIAFYDRALGEGVKRIKIGLLNPLTGRSVRIECNQGDKLSRFLTDTERQQVETGVWGLRKREDKTSISMDMEIVEDIRIELFALKKEEK